MSSLITFGLGQSSQGGVTALTAALGEVATYGNPSYQPDPNATYVLMRDGLTVERVGGGAEVGKVQYAVPGGTRLDRYDASGHVISSVFVPTP